MKIYSVLLIISSIAALAFCIHRDIILEGDYAGDLRNRIVGARLIEDGISPYFHKWSKEDGIRYYDQEDYLASKVSNITATPFFHRLLIPIADYPQITIGKIWLLCEYLMYAIILLIALSFCSNLQQKAIVSLIALLLLFTEAWKVQLINGQIYLAIPFFASLFIFFFVRQHKWYNYFLSGMFAVSLILIRPNSLILFLPFITLAKYIDYKKILIFSLPFVIATSWIFFSKTELQYWKDYYAAVEQHIQGHQGFPIQMREYKPTPGYQQFEGIDLTKIYEYEQQHHITKHSELANFFVALRIIFHYQIPYKIIATTSVGLILILFYFFFRKSKGIIFNQSTIIITLIFGYCLYMISDFSSPIYRHQYYTVQWFLPLLLAFALYKQAINKWYFILLIAGIVLNITNLPFLKMQHTIGEYLILITLLLFSFSYMKKLAYE
jgi:hypothetical protein